MFWGVKCKSTLLGPLWEMKFCSFSLLKIKIGWAMGCRKIETYIPSSHCATYLNFFQDTDLSFRKAGEGNLIS